MQRGAMKQIFPRHRPPSYRLITLLLALLVALSASATASAQKAANPVEAVVQRQLDAYNRQDVEAFVLCFTEDVVIVREGSEVVTNGREMMRTNYAALFQRFPKNHCTLLKRMVVGHHAVDEELIEGRDGEPFRTIAIYTIKDGLISHVRFLSRETTK